MAEREEHKQSLAATETSSDGVELETKVFSEENHAIDRGGAATSEYLTGLRLHLMTLGLCLGLYLVNLEVTIIGTSLIAIGDDLNSFSQSGWILTGYLITYTGFIIIWSKFSDIAGRKLCMILTLTLFVAFSAGCGAARTMNQLIICRCFQGIGAAGGFALTILIIYEMVPVEKYPGYGALMAADMALATLSGPLFGGVISDNSAWRWVFLLNVPTGIVAIAILFLAIPAGFPNHGKVGSMVQASRLGIGFSIESLKQLDFLGAGVLLGASMLLAAGLLEGGVAFDWSSSASISILVVSGVLWVIFFMWERMITGDNWRQEPVFPWRFLFNREWMGVLLSSFFNGMPFYVLVVGLPQRLQAVNGVTPFQAGLRILPFTFLASIGAIIANLVASKGVVAPIYIQWFYSILTVIGSGLLTTLPIDESLPRAFYGYETLAGLGLGATFSIAILVTPQTVEKRDLATATGALIEFRILGGAMGLAIVNSVMNNYLTNHLSPLLSPENLEVILQSTSEIRRLTPELHSAVITVFANGYNIQFKILTGLAAAQLLAIGMMWRKEQIAVVKKK